MGIPSYYRKLKDTVSGLISNSGPTEKPFGLYFDFNCLIYHVLRNQPPLPQDTDEELRIQWENQLIADVIKYVQKIVGIVDPTDEIMISIDGVVPFAKMKQQRLRRFKAAATAGATSWDRNAITPGTYFMERLSQRLKNSCKGKKWIIEDADIPGEGEQKIMRYLRSQVSTNRTYVIYGLDADLIVLSLLQKHTIWLFRENTEYGEAVLDALGDQTYVYMSIEVLKAFLTKELNSAPNAILNYAMAMCFLGNDFLPHGLGHKMSDEGHAVMMEILKANCNLVDDSGNWRIDGIRSFVGRLAGTERRDIERALRRKLSHSPPITEETSPDFYPAEKVEHVFFGESMAFKQHWYKIYYEEYFGGNYRIAGRSAAHYYYQGLHWIRAYYLGEPYSVEWFYPYFLPPLWSDVLRYLDKGFTAAGKVASDTTMVLPQPQEQLALVLPVESYWLIRRQDLRGLPYKAPQYWPLQYMLFSCGKKWMWECEAQIPLLTLRSLRRLCGTVR